MKNKVMDNSVEICGESLELLSQRAIYWQKKKTLILADLHLGKAGHFRKHGIPVPTTIHIDDLKRLSYLIGNYEVDRVFFLGDLFHSDLNNEWDIFSSWLNLYPVIKFILIKGNHDILGDKLYPKANLDLVESVVEKPFYFTHIAEKSKLYNLSGHIHPCVKMNGSGKQGLRLPCFYFGKNEGILPAFGLFTGLYPIKASFSDKVFVIAENEVIELTN